jgi:hypothetical protein
MRFIALALCALIVTGGAALGQKKVQSPAETAMSFYRTLREKRYVEGFRKSVYREAIEGLSSAELKDLEPDFEQTFSAIPQKIEASGEQITGDRAVVYLKFEGAEEAQPVGLVLVNGEWLVGDQETLRAVSAQGRSFFFNSRIAVNENEAAEMLMRIVGAQMLFARKYQGQYASLERLIQMSGVPKDLEGGVSGGYRYEMTMPADQTSFFLFATPVGYGKTGRLSFYADVSGVRAEDLKGERASASSPLYQPK